MVVVNKMKFGTEVCINNLHLWTKLLTLLPKFTVLNLEKILN